MKGGALTPAQRRECENIAAQAAIYGSPLMVPQHLYDALEREGVDLTNFRPTTMMPTRPTRGEASS